MFGTAALSLVLFNVALTLGQDQECLSPLEGGPRMSGEQDCCSAPSAFGEDMHDKMHQCKEQSGMKKPERGGGPRVKPDDSVMDCMEECVMKSIGMVGDDGAMDKAKLQATVMEIYTDDWAPVAAAALEKCFGSATSKVSAASTCKSGSRQFIQCFSRELFLNCPAAKWTGSDQCTKFKQIYAKCENKPAMFLMHGKRLHNHRHH